MQVLQPHEGEKFPLSYILRERALARLRGLDYDATITYGDLNVALGIDVVHDKRGRTAVLRAGRILLRDDRKKLVNIRTVGYRVIQSKEQAACSQHEQGRARRWLKRALETVTYVALDDLPPTEVAKALTEQARVGLSLSFMRKLRKQVLPPRSQMALPSGEKLVEMFKKRA